MPGRLTPPPRDELDCSCGRCTAVGHSAASDTLHRNTGELLEPRCCCCCRPTCMACMLTT